MRITNIRDITVPLEGNISNAIVSFNDHTVSLVAVVSDQTRNGKAVVGFGFNSIGRYAQSGILRDRIIPRILNCPSELLLATNGTEFDAAAVARIAMKNEKPGGHGDRAGAVGALELAIWDLNAKLADEPAWMTIAKNFSHSVEADSAKVYAAGGYYYAEDSASRLRKELEAYQAQGYGAFKMKIGGATLTEDLDRIDTALMIAGSGNNLAVDANGRFDLDSALEYGEAIAPLGLRWYEEPGDPLDYQIKPRANPVLRRCDSNRGKPVQSKRHDQPRTVWWNAKRKRCFPDGRRFELRAHRIFQDGTGAGKTRFRSQTVPPPRRPSD